MSSEWKPYLIFVRSKFAFCGEPPNWHDLPCFRPLQIDADIAFVDVDTIVAPYHLPVDKRVHANDLANELFGDPRPTWLDYAEVLEIGPDIGWAQVWAGEEAYSEEFDDHLKEPSSAFIARVLTPTGGVEPPTFGRKMLLVSLDEDEPESQRDWVSQRLRKALSNCRSVWHGRSFLAFCFVDSRRCESILAPLRGLLGRDEVIDYLLVQPLKVVLTDESGISPLETWLTNRASRFAEGHAPGAGLRRYRRAR